MKLRWAAGFRRRALALVGCAMLMLTSGASAQKLLYGEDLVRQLASPGEIRSATTIRAKLRKESKSAEPLFKFAPLPFADIATAPDTTRVDSERPKQWEMPTFPSIPPALPPDMPEEIRKQIEADDDRFYQTVTPTEFSDIPLEQREVIPYRSRPRKVEPGEEFNIKITEMPPAFSVRRYFESDPNVFLELAAFGGTTSFKAEEAYKAMKQAAVEQTAMEGFGEQAFLTRVIVVDESSKPQEDVSPYDGPPVPEAPPFEDILPEDQARPDLLDSGAAAALTAPAFTDLPVADLEGKKITFPSPPKKYVPAGGKVKQSLLVMVAYYPDEAVTLSFAIEERMGTVQDLMSIAMLAQRKLKEEIVAHD